MSRVDALLKKLTLSEKISLLAGSDLWFSRPIRRVGIPTLHMADGPNGVRGQWSKMSPRAAATPIGIALGASWNPELVEKVGNLLADEVHAKNANILLAPTVNIHRTPIAGRNFECFSEDPYLSGMIASAYIRGLQMRGVGACIKHFVANDQEFERTSMSSDVDERTLREIYLEPFRLAIRNANPWAVMSGYNRVNGEYACQNDHTLLDILKGEWGYDGLVISDWFGTYDEGAPAGGLDLEMPGPARWMSAPVVKMALKQKRLSLARLDDKVRRLLRTIEKAGLFDDAARPPERELNLPEHRQLLREVARETIVLLKNEDRFLPLGKKVKSIAVIGPYAASAQIFGGGSSSGFRPYYTVSPVEGILHRAGSTVRVETAPGCFIYKTLPPLAPETLSTPKGKPGLALSLFNGPEMTGKPRYKELTDQTHFDWFDHSVPKVDQENFSMLLEGFFTPQQDGLHQFSLRSVGRSRLYMNGSLLLDCWEKDQYGQQRIAEVDLRTGQPYELRLEYIWQGSKMSRSVNLGCQPPHAVDLMEEAVQLAKKADVVVLVLGLDRESEAEGFDRPDMKLPGRQDELARRVLKANKNTVVVINTGSAVEMPWAGKAPAILQCWYNGQEHGNALSDVLFGDANPSGKLPTTFPVRLEDNPAYINYPGEFGHVRYGEGIFVGYRYYDKKQIEPLFPFGHGLSYTAFEYSNLALDREILAADGQVTVIVDVANTGKRAGSEVVQVYVHDVDAGIARPPMELKAFGKVHLQPGETKTLRFVLDREAFWYFDVPSKEWQVRPGRFDILIGASSRDIRLSKRLEILPGARSGARLHTGMTFRFLLADEAGRAILFKHLGDLAGAAEMQMVLGMTVEQVADLYGAYLTPEIMAAIRKDFDAT